MVAAIGLSKRELRRALLRFCGFPYPVTTTSAGAGDGSTFVAAGYNGSQVAFFKYWWALLTPDGDDAVDEYRNIQDIDDTGTFTMFQPFSAQVDSASVLELMPVRPDQITEVLNQAMVEAYPALHVNSVDDSLVVVADQQEYDLPIGITYETITKIMVEGPEPWTGIPYWQMDTTPSADGTQFYLNRLSSQFQAFDADKTIYIYYQAYLNALDNDDTYGEITHDTLADDEVGVILTPRTNPWQLLMLYARAILFEMLAGAPGVQNKTEALASAARFRQLAEAKKSSLRMDGLEAAGYL